VAFVCRHQWETGKDLERLFKEEGRLDRGGLLGFF
jgi:hypothetical protein